ncbi:(Fe-S)-binding protein [Tepidibacillus infernus]|uniref:(Fe-S)-binding protein n=1 Tax=Tepidibacillus infernus TaxID=1806172 RepID=UPI003A4BF8C1
MSTLLNQLQQDLRYDLTNACVQCGYCLPVCPTYLTMEKETHSPRGRINLVKMVAEGKIKDINQIREPLELCVGCRACETACPTGVQYERILDSAKKVLEKHKTYKPSVRIIRNILFKHVFPKQKVMVSLGNLIWLYQKTGLQKMAHTTKIIDLLPYHLGEYERTLPILPSNHNRKKESTLKNTSQKPKIKVAFFQGCIMQGIYQRINHYTVELMKLANIEVVIPENQTCCGALHAHSGGHEQAIALAKQNIDVFEKLDIDYIVNNAGGCGAALIEYDQLLTDDPDYAEKAKRFVAKVRDISQVLVEASPLPLKKQVNEIVTYQRSCHMTNVQKIKEEPLELIKQIPGLKLVEMKRPNMCCGSGGIYNLIHYEESMKILNLKMDTVKETHASTIITTNPGCLIQMQKGVIDQGLQQKVRVVHLVELLAESSGIM